jgi:F-type H+-transporting ATPase subunit epsilon
MRGTLKFEMATPERALPEREADIVVLPAFDGEMGVLPGHEPFLVQLKAGELRAAFGRQTQTYSISGGFAEILDNTVRVFAETAEMASEIDEERARLGLEKARAALRRKGAADMGLRLDEAEAMLRREAARLKVAGRRRSGGKQTQGRP